MATTIATQLPRRTRSFVDTLVAIMDAYYESHEATKRIRYLQNKTDAELARMGLKRYEIVQHVFSGMGYF